MAMSQTKRMKMKAQRKGYRQGERSMNKANEQADNQSGNSEGIVGQAERAWIKWAKDNDITRMNTERETFKLMEEAFIDGYTNGFVKRFTEG